MATLHVTGMSCNHCVDAVKKAVNALDPKAGVEIDLPSGNVEITSTMDMADFVTAIEDAGYDVDK